jgi:arylsulfatase
MEVYAAQVEVMDRGIGAILSELERRGALDNTLILFLSDNGGCAEELNTQGWFDYLLRGGERVAREHTLDGRPVRVGNFPDTMPGPDDTYQSYGVPWANLSNTPFRLYKSYTHEGGVATPLLVHWPAGIPSRGELRHQTGHLVDIMATCVDVSGTSYPLSVEDRSITPMEGLSLLPAFSDRAMDRDGLFFEHEGRRAALVGQWKLVARGRNRPWELYDMDADRTETQDLAGRYPDEVRRLAAVWEEWAGRTQVIPWEAPG